MASRTSSLGTLLYKCTAHASVHHYAIIWYGCSGHSTAQSLRPYPAFNETYWLTRL